MQHHVLHIPPTRIPDPRTRFPDALAPAEPASRDRRQTGIGHRQLRHIRQCALRAHHHDFATSSTASNAANRPGEHGTSRNLNKLFATSWPKRSPEPPAKIMAAVFGLFDTLPEKCTVLAPVSLKSRRAAASSATSTSAVGTNTGSITQTRLHLPRFSHSPVRSWAPLSWPQQQRGVHRRPLAWRHREGCAYGSLISRAVARHAATVAWRPGMRQNRTAAATILLQMQCYHVFAARNRSCPGVKVSSPSFTPTSITEPACHVPASSCSEIGSSSRR